jgi:hypothetical protein
VMIYSTAQHAASGFTPGSAPDIWDSGKLAGNPGSVQVGVTLANHTTYYAYVQVWETGTIASAWAYSAFTVVYDAPATPTVTAVATTTASTGYPVITLSVQCHTNLLSAVDASFESGIGTWTATPSADFTLSKSTAWAVDGSYSLGVKCTTAAIPVLAPTSYPCEPNTLYTFIASVRTAATVRTWKLEATWEKSTGAVISTGTAATGADSTAGVRLRGTLTSPTTAAKVVVKLTTTAAWAVTETHNLDAVGVFPGTVAAWSAGGFVGNTSAVITRSDGLYVRGASQANPLLIPTPSQLAKLNDYECVVRTSYTYSAVLNATSGVSSAAGVSNAAEITSWKWWIIDPTNPSSAVSPQPVQWNPVTTEQSAAHMVMGQPVMSVIANVMLNQDFMGTFELFTQTAYEAFQNLLLSQKTCFIQSSFSATDSGYFRIGPQPGGLSMGTGNRAKDSKLNPSTATSAHRNVAVTAVAAARPSV